MAEFEAALLARVEDAGINASAPPQQLWQDGWLLRMSPGKAKRARCVNAVAAGRLPLDDKLQRAAERMRRARLPLIVRITPFSQPSDLDAQLAARGFTVLDDTQVMVLPALLNVRQRVPPPEGLSWQQLPCEGFARAVSELRGSSIEQQAAHAERLRNSPVRYHAHALVRAADGAVLACGQYAQESELVGLYDVFTDPAERGRGLARALCEHMLASAAADGAAVAYLQVEHGNHAARAVYQRLGFADAYSYHYRQAPP